MNRSEICARARLFKKKYAVFKTDNIPMEEMSNQAIEIDAFHKLSRLAESANYDFKYLDYSFIKRAISILNARSKNVSH